MLRFIVAALSIPPSADAPDPILLAQRSPETELREPFKVFDNLYYVGINWVSAWVIETDEGLILIDTLYGGFVEPMLENIRKLGLDPAEIKYVFCTHGHFDHVGGAARVKELSGATVGMTAEDWKMFLEPSQGGSGYERIPVDLIVEDGSTIALGGTQLNFYVTPGHTPGVLSIEFPVSDGANRHKAFMFGGVGLNFSGVDRCRLYVQSVQRIMAMQGIEVNIPNHPNMGGVFDRAAMLALRKPGDPHPFVAPADFQAWLRELMENIQRKLEAELEHAQ